MIIRNLDFQKLASLLLDYVATWVFYSKYANKGKKTTIICSDLLRGSWKLLRGFLSHAQPPSHAA